VLWEDIPRAYGSAMVIFHYRPMRHVLEKIDMDKGLTVFSLQEKDICEYDFFEKKSTRESCSECPQMHKTKSQRFKTGMPRG